MHATIRSYHGVDQNRTAELTAKVNETLVPQLPGAARLQGLLPRRGRQRHLHLVRSLRDRRAVREVDEARHQLDPRREARPDHSERAEDPERQGRRSQQRARPGRVTRPHDERALRGPLSFGSPLGHDKRTCEPASDTSASATVIVVSSASRPGFRISTSCMPRAYVGGIAHAPPTLPAKVGLIGLRRVAAWREQGEPPRRHLARRNFQKTKPPTSRGLSRSPLTDSNR